MADVKAIIEYEIESKGNSMILDTKKYQLLKNIEKYGSLTMASKKVEISYRTTLNYINQIESVLGAKVVNSTKGGKNKGGSKLTPEGYSIILECDKINAIMKLHNEINEINSKIVKIDDAKNVMTIKFSDYGINTPLKEGFEVGDDVLALINYNNIVLMLEPYESSIRNILKGTIVGMSLKHEIIRVKVNVGGELISCNITVSAEKELNLTIGKEVYIGFKAMSVATLKL